MLFQKLQIFSFVGIFFLHRGINSVNNCKLENTVMKQPNIELHMKLCKWRMSFYMRDIIHFEKRMLCTGVLRIHVLVHSIQLSNSTKTERRESPHYEGKILISFETFFVNFYLSFGFVIEISIFFKFFAGPLRYNW